MVRLGAGEHDGAVGSRGQRRVDQEVQRHPPVSPVPEAVAQLREQALVELGQVRRRRLRLRRELLDELALPRVETRGRHHVHADAQVAALRAAQRRDAALDREHVAALHSRPHLERHRAVEGLDRGGRAEDRVGHRDLERREQVVAVAAEGVVRGDGDLQVQIAVRAAGGAHLARAGELQAQAGLNAGRDVDRHRAAGARARPWPWHVAHGYGMVVP